MVLSGNRAGEFGPHESINPRVCRYWFENIGEDDLELLQVAAYVDGATDGGRTNVEALRFRPGTETSSARSDRCMPAIKTFMGMASPTFGRA